MNKIVDIMTFALGVSAIVVLTKNKNGTNFVTALGKAAVNLVQGASGQKTS